MNAVRVATRAASAFARPRAVAPLLSRTVVDGPLGDRERALEVGRGALWATRV